MIGAVLATVTVASLLNQLVVAVPAIILASNTLTAALKGIFNIENENTIHIVSWIVGILTGVGFVAFNGLTFGVAPWLEYVLGGVAGLLGAAASNGVYDWEVMKTLFNAITNLLGTSIHGEAFRKR